MPIPTAAEKKLSLNLVINAGDFNLGHADKVYKIITKSMIFSTITKLLMPPQSSPLHLGRLI